jgi:molybdenum cofactor biosynthesis protein A
LGFQNWKRLFLGIFFQNSPNKTPLKGICAGCERGRKRESMLYDNHGRQISYVRLAVTDRCNLRCFYFMPEEGIKYVAREELLSYEEMERLIRMMVPMGIDKVRITGGEPFLRKGMVEFLEKIATIEGLKKLNITTNGTLTASLVPRLKEIGIHSVNLSLDSLDPSRFLAITRRDSFQSVMDTLEALLSHGIPTKINTVVMNGRNIEDLVPLTELASNRPIDVRFIEEMPFNGEGAHEDQGVWNHTHILAHLRAHFPDIEKIPDPPHSTSMNYHIPGFNGTVGIIAAYSRLFCGSCNRIRLTPQGILKTCLYDSGVFNIRDLMRAGADDRQVAQALREALGHRAKDGFEAEQDRRFGRPVSESMATIGG